MDTKYRKHILDNPKIKQLTLDTINELADKHKKVLFGLKHIL